MGPDGATGSTVSAFRAFLGRTAAGFAIFGDGEPLLPAEPFGILVRHLPCVSRGEAPVLSRYGEDRPRVHRERSVRAIGLRLGQSLIASAMAANTILTLLSTDRIAEHTASRHWRDETIYMEAAAHAARTPHAFAVRDAVRRLTYRELVEAADCLAGDLAAKGVRPGQRVAVWLPSRVETAVAVLACSRNGYVCCPSLHRDHTVPDVRKLLERVRATALITQANHGADAEHRDVFAMAAELPFLRAIYHAEDVGVGLRPTARPPATIQTASCICLSRRARQASRKA